MNNGTSNESNSLSSAFERFSDKDKVLLSELSDVKTREDRLKFCDEHSEEILAHCAVQGNAPRTIRRTEDSATGTETLTLRSIFEDGEIGSPPKNSKKGLLVDYNGQSFLFPGHIAQHLWPSSY